MSIVTRTGDDGTTSLMYGRRVPKSHPRIAACGAIDELNAALGLARAEASSEILLTIQKELIGLMGELATDDFYYFLGYNTIVPPYVREGLLARTLDNDAAIEATRKPVFFVYGEADRVVSPRMCTHLETLVPDSAVATYPDTGHMPFWEAPERFNRELRAFRSRA